MTTLSIRLMIAVGLGSIATPVWAANWVTVNGWDWTDLASASRSGDTVTFAVAMGVEEDVPPGPNAQISYYTINCRTLQESRIFNGVTETWPAREESTARTFCR